MPRRSSAGDVETGCLGHEPLGEFHLCSPGVPRLGNHLRVGNRAVEIPVAVGVGAEQPGHVLARHHHPERIDAPSRPGVVPARAATSSTARPSAAPCLGIKTGALHLQREAYGAQALDQRGALVAQRRSVLTRVVLEIDEHVGSSGCGHAAIIAARIAAHPVTNDAVVVTDLAVTPPSGSARRRRVAP